MSNLLFWRKTKETGQAKATENVAVDESNPLPVRPLQDDTDDPTRVEIKQSYMPPVAGVTRMIGPLQIPGLTTGSAYTAGDTFGTLLKLHDCFRAEKNSGTIVAVFFYDLDDEGKNKTLHFFAQPITTGTDDSAYALNDWELIHYRGSIGVTSFQDFANCQMGQNITDRLWIKGDSPDLWCRVETEDADNIAAGSLPLVAVIVVPD